MSPTPQEAQNEPQPEAQEARSEPQAAQEAG